MSYKYVIYEKEGEIAKITLNRPEKLNAIDFPGDGGIFDDFMAALDEAAEDRALKVVIIKGAGRGFSAGHDLSRVYHVYEEWDEEPGKRRPSQQARLWTDRKWMEGHQKILLHPKITITQVHGYCLGEGAIIAEMCDMSIVANDAQIGHPEQRLGFAGSGMNLVPLFQTVGYKKARWMVLTGDYIDGIEAERIGWATKAVPYDKLEEEVNRMAKEAALLPMDGIYIGKASNHWICDILGLTHGLAQGYLTHTMFTNLRFNPGEHNFLKDRKQKGTREGFHKRDERYAKL
jgi:enoyl-CoA hydratase